jgi:hypothetical protein
VNTSIDENVLVQSLVDRIDTLESNVKERKWLKLNLNKLIAELKDQLL